MSYSLDADSVLPLWGSRCESAEITLFCLPHAGGGASAYRRLAAQWRPAIDLQPVQLPGREDLGHLSPAEDAATLVAALGTALLPRLRRPYGLFGHSLGAALAAELVAWLAARADSTPQPELLVISARTGDFRAGEVSARDHDGARLDDDALVGGLTRLGGTAAELLEHPELRAYVLRALRDDMRMAGTYRPSFHGLPLPVLAFGGTEDDSVPIDKLRMWRQWAERGFRLCLLPGGHFYLYEQGAPMAEVILAELAGKADKVIGDKGSLVVRPASGTSVPGAR